MTMVIKALHDLNIILSGNLIAEYTVDEELSGNDTLACVMKGCKADAGICCEASSLRVQPASIGCIWFEIRIYGKPVGIQRRWEGVSALNKGFKIVQAISDLEQIRIAEVSHPLYSNNRGALPCSVGIFEAGSSPSSFPDTCTLKGGIATLPGEDSKNVKERFTEYIMKVAKLGPWLKTMPRKLNFAGYFAKPSEISIGHPICTTLVKNFKDAMGKDPVTSGRERAPDTSFLVKYGKTPWVIFGPGLTEQMRAVNEFVRINDLLAATKILSLAITDWCGIKE
jgi:acetylornithine deacetylase